MRYHGHKNRVVGSATRPTIELEFISGDTLANYFAQNQNVSSATIKSIIRSVFCTAAAYKFPDNLLPSSQVVTGLGHLHGKGYIHRDLKQVLALVSGARSNLYSSRLNNIMRDATGVVKIIDLGE